MKPYLPAMAVGLALCGSAYCAPPAAVETTFQVGGVDFKLTLPPGYCLPNGQIAPLAKKAAAADVANATDLTAYRCELRGDAVEQALLIKTPLTVVSTTVERRTLLAQVGAAFDNPVVTSALSSGEIDKSSAAALSKAQGAPVTVKSEIKPAGKDETCAYVAGSEAIGEGGRLNRVAVAACMTAVHGRVLSIYAYGPYAGPRSLDGLAPKAKSVALTLIRENE